MKYHLTRNIIVISGITLYQIQRIRDGFLGGYVESEKNLDQNGNCFIYGDARVFGDAKVSQYCYTFTTPEYNITLTDNHLKIGCEQYLIEEWPNLIQMMKEKHTLTLLEVYEKFYEVVKILRPRRFK